MVFTKEIQKKLKSETIFIVRSHRVSNKAPVFFMHYFFKTRLIFFRWIFYERSESKDERMVKNIVQKSEQKWKFELKLFSGFEQCQKSKTVRLEG